MCTQQGRGRERERERESEHAQAGEGQRDSQAGSTLSAQSPMQGLDTQTMRS